MRNCVCNKCIINSTRSVFTKTGRRTNRYELINSAKLAISEYIVDECLLVKNRTDEKCDYLYQIPSQNISILLEIKGSDVDYAAIQILKSISLLKEELNNHDIWARILPTRVYAPDLNTTALKNLKKTVKQKLIVKQNISDNFN